MRIPNIMIGNSGVGKSTFVNKLFGKDISKVDSFCGGVTQSAQVIDIKSNDGKNDNVVCRIVDTKGIELGEEGKDSLRKICEKLKIPKDDEGYINAVFWLIDSTTSRVDVGIKDLWKLLTNPLEPRYVAFIITKCDLSDFSTIWKIRGVIEKMHKSIWEEMESGLEGNNESYKCEHPNVNIHLYSSKIDKIYSEYPRYCNFGIHYRQNKKKKIMNEFKMNCFSIKESSCDEDDAVLQSKIEQAMATVRKGLQTGLRNGMNKHMIIDYDGEKGTIHCHECGKTESACRYGCQNCQIISMGTHKVKCSQCGKKWIRPCDSCDIWRILEDTIQNLRKFKSEGNIVEGVSQKEYYLKDIEEFERNVKIIEKEEEKEEQSSSFMDKAGEKFGDAAVKVYQSSTSFAIKGSVEVLKGVKRNSKEIREMLLLSFQVGVPMAIFGTKAILTLTKLILQARQRTSRREE